MTETNVQTHPQEISDADAAELRRVAARPGVHAADVYDLDVEFVGGRGDCDTSAGIVRGSFTPEQVRSILPALDVSDCRSARG